MRNFAKTVAACLIVAAIVPGVRAQSSSQPKTLFNDALQRERTVRRDLDAAQTDAAQTAVLTKVRALATAYEDMSKLFPDSNYSDDALWHGAVLVADAFWQCGDPIDRTLALRLFSALTSRFPSSTLISQVAPHTKRLEQAKLVPAQAATSRTRQPDAIPAVVNTTTAVPTGPLADLTSITREVLPEVLRIVIQLGKEVTFYDERIDGPPRVFLDLQNTQAVDTLRDAVIPFPDDIVKKARIGRQPNSRTRVVLDLKSSTRYSIYTLYDPYRIVVDFERKSAPAPTSDVVLARATEKPVAPRLVTSIAAKTAPPSVPRTVSAMAPTSAVKLAPTSDSVLAPTTERPIAPTSDSALAPTSAITVAPTSDSVLAPTTESPIAPTSDSALAPLPPSTNVNGGFSLSRQLGLGVARIVIDPGHGGHDPGAKAKGLEEAELVLDVALRLEKLLQAAGVEVMMTRRTDTFISLEERTAIANRAGADLFLSIHSNASSSELAHGVETYFLNFAPNPEAEAVAARENAGGAKTMRNLPDIVRAIALNNKIDESRDFASMVQTSLYTRLSKTNRNLRNLGVKQAPFMVLIGATMPSILAEISFITNRQEASLLKSDKYKDQIAEALLAGVLRYQQALKKVPAIAAQRQ